MLLATGSLSVFLLASDGVREKEQKFVAIVQLVLKEPNVSLRARVSRSFFYRSVTATQQKKRTVSFLHSIPSIRHAH